jgi:hypothetical protein
MITIHVKPDLTTPPVTLSASRDTLVKLSYFANLLSHGMQESQTNTLVLEEVDPLTVQRCVDFLATDTTLIHDGNPSVTAPHLASQPEPHLSDPDRTNQNKLSPYDELRPDQKRIFDEVPYLDLCRLHQFADRLVYDKLKHICSHLLQICLNQVTVIQLLAYRRTVQVNDAVLSTALATFIERSEHFQTDVVASLISHEDMEELLNLPISPIVKVLIGLTWCQANATDADVPTILNRVQSELPKASPTDARHKLLIERIVALGNPQLMAALLNLIGGLTSSNLSPMGYKIIRLAEFDATKLSAGYVQTRIGSGYSKERYKVLELLYDGVTNWVLELPTFGFVGLYGQGESNHEMSLRQDLIDWAHRDDPEFGGVKLLNQVLDAIECAVAQICVNNRVELKIEAQSAASLLESHYFIRSRNHHRDPLTRRALTANTWVMKLKVKKHSILIDHWTGSQVSNSELTPSRIAERYPYLMHRGLLQMSKIYVNRSYTAIFIQRHLVHGTVEMSPVIKPRKYMTQDNCPNSQVEFIEPTVNPDDVPVPMPGKSNVKVNESSNSLSDDLGALTRLKSVPDNKPSTQLREFLATAPAKTKPEPEPEPKIKTIALN